MDPWMDWRIRWVCGIKVWVKFQYETMGQCGHLKPWPSKVPENMTWLTCLRFLHLSVFHSSDMFTESHVWSHPFWGFIGSKLGDFVCRGWRMTFPAPEPSQHPAWQGVIPGSEAHSPHGWISWFPVDSIALPDQMLKHNFFGWCQSRMLPDMQKSLQSDKNASLTKSNSFYEIKPPKLESFSTIVFCKAHSSQKMS